MVCKVILPYTVHTFNRGTYSVAGRPQNRHQDRTRLRPGRDHQARQLLSPSIVYTTNTHSYTQIRSVFTGVAMMGVMHFYFKFTQPLFIQALMGLKTIYDASLVSIHLFGKPAVGPLERPFKAASMFGGECTSCLPSAGSLSYIAGRKQFFHISRSTSVPFVIPSILAMCSPYIGVHHVPYSFPAKGSPSVSSLINSQFLSMGSVYPSVLHRLQWLLSYGCCYLLCSLYTPVSW